MIESQQVEEEGAAGEGRGGETGSNTENKSVILPDFLCLFYRYSDFSCFFQIHKNISSITETESEFKYLM